MVKTKTPLDPAISPSPDPQNWKDQKTYDGGDAVNEENNDSDTGDEIDNDCHQNLGEGRRHS